jgi:hypothetical protein
MISLGLSPPSRGLSTRARNVLAGMRNPDMILYSYGDYIRYWREYSPDGECFYLTMVANVGKVTIAELLDARLIERKTLDNGAVAYRLFVDDHDFGDLWVA